MSWKNRQFLPIWHLPFLNFQQTGWCAGFFGAAAVNFTCFSRIWNFACSASANGFTKTQVPILELAASFMPGRRLWPKLPAKGLGSLSDSTSFLMMVGWNLWEGALSSSPLSLSADVKKFLLLGEVEGELGSVLILEQKQKRKNKFKTLKDKQNKKTHRHLLWKN